VLAPMTVDASLSLEPPTMGIQHMVVLCKTAEFLAIQLLKSLVSRAARAPLPASRPPPPAFREETPRRSTGSYLTRLHAVPDSHK
jgi:hypothetical protein